MQRFVGAASAAVAALATLVAMSSARAASLEQVAWAVADQPTTASYTPSVRYNSTGGTVTVTHSSTGKYAVTLTGFDKGDHDDMQVTALGTTGYCNSAGWSSGKSPDLGVDCYAPGGILTDMPFTILYQKRSGSTGSAAKGVAFLWANEPTGASYTPEKAYQYNSTGGTNTVTRSAMGTYTAHLPGLTKSGGHVQVTAYGSASGRCVVKSWKASGSGTNVQIACVDATGNPADEDYDLAYSIGMTMGQVDTNTPGLYVLAGKSTARQYTVSAPDAFNGFGGPTKIKISRTDTGEYSVTLPSGTHKSLVAFVTGYDSGNEFCNVGSIAASKVTVSCFEADGTPADNDFDLTVQARK